jgi:DNA-directed RNA polymerase I, II, and III subunit RPABC1
MNNKESVVRSFKTIIEMLEDRKIDIGDVSKDSAHELLDVFVNNNKVLFEVIINDVKIVYCLSAKVKWSELKKFFEDEKPYSLYICVAKDKMSQNNTKMLGSLKSNLQVFDMRHLQFNISKHSLVPKHEIVRDENEIKELIEKFTLKSKFQLPIILKIDAMSKYLGLKNGDVIKITRVSPTAGEYVVYRCCI